jgi:hypothetical protein
MPRFIITGVPRLAIQDFWKRIWDEAVRRVFSVIVQNHMQADAEIAQVRADPDAIGFR